jgi:hypothetical protein
MRRTFRISIALVGLLCLAGIASIVFGRRDTLTSRTFAETFKAEAPFTTTPYRRLILFQIPAGSSEAVAAIPDVPAGKKLVIEFAAMRAFLPSTDPNFKGGIESFGGAFVPFVLNRQGSFGGIQHFVAAQPMDLVYESGGIGKGIYAGRNGTSGVANIHAYIVGHIE